MVVNKNLTKNYRDGIYHPYARQTKKINKKISLDLGQEIMMMIYGVTFGNSPMHPTLHQNYLH
jgi:hypothetical protein